jgi:hypothetical protein
MKWSVRSHRLSIFFGPQIQSLKVVEWAQLTGVEPESSINRGGQQVSEGPFSKGRLLLSKQLPLRLDVLYTGTVGMLNPNGGGFPTIGDYEPTLNEFREVANKLVDAFPVNRLALGSVLDCVTSDKQDSQSFLLAHIRGPKFDLQEAQDFVYQINRPRKSKIFADTHINRVAKWSTGTFVVTSVDSATGRFVPQAEQQIASFETDVSTPVDRPTSMTSDEMKNILGELVMLSSELVDKGDTK